MKIKTGDKVRITTGKDKGKEGKVIQVFPQEQRVVVEGMNKAVRHLRRTASSKQGQKIEFPSPLHVSNLMLVSTQTGKSGRVGAKWIEKDGLRKKVRVLHTKDGAEDLE